MNQTIPLWVYALAGALAAISAAAGLWAQLAWNHADGYGHLPVLMMTGFIGAFSLWQIPLLASIEAQGGQL